MNDRNNDRVFRETVWSYWREFGRHTLPWREAPSPYNVIVSELMLQQTQVERVLPKFLNFIDRFPDFHVLRDAPLSDVLIAWQGLGYNRRAKYLHRIAYDITQRGYIPRTISELVELPGIGPNTAGAILAYAFNLPVVYIETNIRTVYLYHFFANKQGVADSDILPIVERTVDRKQPRLWYSALMDYGTFVKKQGVVRNDSTISYKKQSTFEGSLRQMRGAIVRALAERPLVYTDLQRVVVADERFDTALQQLCHEALVAKKGNYYVLFDARLQD